MTDFSTVRQHKSRIDRPCHMCGGIINKGETYIRIAMLFEEKFSDICMHKHCYLMLEESIEETTEDEWSPSSVRDYLNEKYCSVCGELEDGCELALIDCPKIVDNYKKNNK